MQGEWALRIGASSVAAVAGVHPWAEVDELLAGVVWQGAETERLDHTPFQDPRVDRVSASRAARERRRRRRAGRGDVARGARVETRACARVRVVVVPPEKRRILEVEVCARPRVPDNEGKHVCVQARTAWRRGA